MGVPVLPDRAEPYRRTLVFTEATVPRALLRGHSTKEGAWAVIHVLDGQLVYRVTDPRRSRWECVLTPRTLPAVIEPTILHEVEPRGSVRFFVEFYRRATSARASLEEARNR